MSADNIKFVAVAVVVALALAVGARSIVDDDTPAIGSDIVRGIPPEATVADVARTWLDAWRDGDTAAMAELLAAPVEDLDARVTSFREGLRIRALRVSPRTPKVAGATATVGFDAAADLAGAGTWTFAGSLSLVVPPDADAPDDWRVAWSRQALHPALSGGRRLQVVRTFAPRAPLLAVDGTPIAGDGAAPTRGVAAQLVGRLGAADAERVAALGDDRYLLGDAVGIAGLQAGFERELAGAPSADIQVVEGDAVVETLGRIEGAPPAPVRTSIDLRVQGAAEAVLAGVDRPAALVAMRPSTGEVLAAVSNPLQGFNRALAGRYPPGSTFKIVTAAALVASGVTADTPTTCPEVAKIGGREFRNAEGAALGTIPFRRAFYESCNTAFVQLAAELDAAALTDAATRFGFNVEPTLEVGAITPSFPEPHSIVDQVSAAIGQGRVITSPLQMASVAATVASGARRTPTFRALAAPPAGEPLPDGVAVTLQQLMRLVVSDGTGRAARMAGEPVAGKTGTAEFGTRRPPRTHVWFVGFRGDVSFAVLVEDVDGFGGTIAAPLARDFLSRIA